MQEHKHKKENRGAMMRKLFFYLTLNTLKIYLKIFHALFFKSFSKRKRGLRGLCASAFVRVFVSVFVLLGMTACAVSHKEQTVSDKDKKEILAAEAYLNTLNLKNAPFVQTWPDGGQSAGVMTYHPGFLLMQYTQPHAMTLRANEHRALFVDNLTASRTSMGMAHNPLGVLLKNPVRLSGSVMVTDVQQSWLGDNGSIQISMAQASNPSRGLVVLRFKQFGKKMALYEIRIIDAARKTTIIDLEPSF